MTTVHVGHSVRIPMVRRETNARFDSLLTLSKASTGCPVLVHPSFIVRGNPIACTRADTFRSCMVTEIEVPPAGRGDLRQGDQDPGQRQDH
jgi:predicted NodU family carbamoyl transferase